MLLGGRDDDDDQGGPGTRRHHGELQPVRVTVRPSTRR
jgi:hypothetical protein